MDRLSRLLLGTFVLTLILLGATLLFRGESHDYSRTDMFEYPVPIMDIPKGTRLEAKMFTYKRFAHSSIIIDAIRSVDELEGRVARRLLQANVPIRDRDLEPINQPMPVDPPR